MDQDVAEPPAAEGVLRPHEGVVFLDNSPGGEQVITHSLLLKRFVAPQQGGPFDLVFADGYGVLASQNSSVCICLEEFFQDRVFQVGRELHVLSPQVSEQSRATPTEEWWSLSARMREHEVRNCKLKLCDDAGTEVDLEVYTLRRPRCASRLCWCLFSLYEVIRLECYSGQPSKWTYNSFASWERILGAQGICGAIVKSWQGMSAADAMAETCHVLPKPGIGSDALVVLLSRWAAAPVRRGGLRDGGASARAASVLSGMLAGACIKGWKLHISFDFDWQYQWPRPPTPCEYVMTLDISTDGLMDVRDWRKLKEDSEQYGGEISPPARKWYMSFQEFVTPGGFVRLFDILTSARVVGDDLCSALVAQIAMAAGPRIEMCYYGSMKIADCSWPLRADEAAGAEDWSLRAIDRLCTEHVYAGKVASSSFKCFGVGVDKFSARAMEVCNGAFVLPDNVAYEAVPQDALGGAHSGYDCGAALNPIKTKPTPNLLRLCVAACAGVAERAALL